jgi:hypothetical protein
MSETVNYRQEKISIWNETWHESCKALVSCYKQLLSFAKVFLPYDQKFRQLEVESIWV